MSETIKSFVERRALEGASVEEAWKDARHRFPYRCVAWNYVSNLIRALKQRDSTPGEKK